LSDRGQLEVVRERVSTMDEYGWGMLLNQLGRSSKRRSPTVFEDASAIEAVLSIIALWPPAPSSCRPDPTQPAFDIRYVEVPGAFNAVS
jgi:hypothetical protein